MRWSFYDKLKEKYSNVNLTYGYITKNIRIEIKTGKRKLNQSPYLVYNFRLFDKVECDKQECFIFGRRQRGYFDLRKLDRTKISEGKSYKKLKLLEKRKTLLWSKI